MKENTMEKQNFENFPRLAESIETVANHGITPHNWNTLLGEINRSIERAEEQAFEAAREKTNEFDEYAQTYRQLDKYKSFTDYKNRKL